MPRFNPPPGWDVPEGFTPPIGWRPDPRWAPIPDGWQLWIVDPVCPSPEEPDHLEATRRRSLRRTSGASPEPAETQAWSPQRDRAQRADAQQGSALQGAGHRGADHQDTGSGDLSTSPWSPTAAHEQHPSTHAWSPAVPVTASSPAPPGAHSPSPAPQGAHSPSHAPPHASTYAPAPGYAYGAPSPTATAGSPAHAPSGMSAAAPATAWSPAVSASSPHVHQAYHPTSAPQTDPGPWYTRPAPTAVAASSCVALVAVAVWAFVLREPPVDPETEGPGKFDVEPPPGPGGEPQGGDQQAGGSEEGPSGPGDLPEEGPSEGTDAVEDLAGLGPLDTFPAGVDTAAHTGPEGTPTNTEPLGTEADLELVNTDTFGRRSIMHWTMDESGDGVEIQLVGETEWDATETVLAENPGNPPPPEGYVYVTQRVRVSTTSSEPFQPFASTLVYWLTDSGDVYGATSALAPDDLFNTAPISAGQEAEGNLILCLPEDVIDGGHWVVAVNHSSNGYVLAP